VLRAFSGGKPCSAQQWRNILSLGIHGERADPAKHTATTEAVERMRILVFDCMKNAGVVVHSLTRPPPMVDLHSQVTDVRKARRIIWELCELSFRWELQAVDRCLYDKRRFSPIQRQQMLLDCFAHEDSNIASVSVSLARTGLGSPLFKDRFPYLQALWRLLDCWPREKPASWGRLPESSNYNAQAVTWERELTHYYAQTFFQHFARPAILPHTLNEDDLI
jgi:hypothetical protein